MEFLVISGAIALFIILINNIMTKPQEAQWQIQQIRNLEQ
jgi:hypothetical protein